MNKHGSLNRVFRLIFNEALGAWIPVAETARARGKRSRCAAALLVSPLIAALSPSLPLEAAGLSAPSSQVTAVASPAPPAPTTLPTGGTVVAGSATLTKASTPGSAVLDIDQTSQRAVIDWNTFNLGSAAQVNFVQPNANAATLNEVMSANPSQIFGKITGTGQIFLVDPSGVLFGKSASVDVGSLTATTDSISNANFMAGNLTLTRNGATGSVVNKGTLQAGIGGYIALLAPQVRNSGVVVAHMGTVAMAAGDSVTLNFDGTHLVGVTTTPATIAALVQNKSAVIAPGGLIILSAQALDQVQGGVVHNSGTLEATGMSTAGGRIVLEAGTVQQTAAGTLDASGTGGGSVQISAAQDISLQGTVSAAATGSGGTGSSSHGGNITLSAGNDVTLQGATLDAAGSAGGGRILIQGGSQAPASGSTAAAPTVALQGNTQLIASSVLGQGGNVTLTADQVGLFGTTTIDASGATGGGSVFAGGGFHGQNASINDAQQTVVASTATIDASATQNGTGGNVAIWSDSQTSFGGNIQARGGSVSGAGGFVEVSSKGTLNFLGTVDASAPHGAAGTLLLDPDNIDIVTGGTTTPSQTSTNPSIDTLAFATNAGTGGISMIDPSTITALTNIGTAVVLQANTDLTISSPIITSGGINGIGGALTFQAGRSIFVNADVISNNGNITFSANDPGAIAADRAAGNAVFDNTGSINAGSGTVSITMGSGPAGNSGTAGTFTGTIEAGNISAASLSIVQSGTTTGTGTGTGPGTVAANGAIDLGEIVLSEGLSISAGSPANVTNVSGNLNAAGAVNVSGLATISVGTGSVTIDGPATHFTTIGLTAGNVTLNNDDAVQFATTMLSGSLTETTLGPIGSTGPVKVAGLTTLTANSGGFGFADPSISLTNPGNHFGGGLALSVPDTGASSTGGFATIVDSGAIDVTSSQTATSLQITAGGAVTLGTSNIGLDLTISTTGNISDTGVTSVGRQTELTAGSAGSITLGSTSPDSFDFMRIVSADNVSLNTANGVDFGNWQGAVVSGWTSNISGNLSITSGGNIQQVGQGNNSNNPPGSNISGITVAGTTTFTANGSGQIQLLLGSTDPFNSSGQTNQFTGGVTLAAANSNTGFSEVEIRDTNPSAVVLAGLTSVGTLNDVYLEYNDATSITLPGMTVTAPGDTGQLFVYGPSVANTATIPANIISQSGPITVNGSTIMAAGSSGDIVLNMSNDFTEFGIANTGARNLTIVNSGPLELVAPGFNQDITGNLSITANGAISDLNNGVNNGVNGVALTVNGTATLNAGPTNDISFTQADVWGGAVSLVGDNVTFNPLTNLILGNSTIGVAGSTTGGTLSISSQNNDFTLTQAAGTAVVMNNTGATTTFGNFGAGITLNSPSNVFGPLAITQAGSIAIAENNAISQASPWSNFDNIVSPVTLTTTGSQAITLTEPSAFMGNLTIAQANPTASSPGAVTVTNTSTTQAASITQGSGEANAWTTYGTVTLNSGGSSIDLNNPNNVLGPLQVIGATGSFDGAPSSVTIFAKSTNASPDIAITDVGATGAWSVGSNGTAGSGVVKLVADDMTGTAGGGNIVLDNPGNVMGDLYLKANNATIIENASILDGPLLSNWDGAGDSGWSVNGSLDMIVANPSGKSITLSNTTNMIGPIGMTTTGTGTLTSVLITDDESITQSSVWNIGAAPITLNASTNQIDLSSFPNVLGNISISTGNGTPTSVAITEDNPITQGAMAWALTGVPVTLVAEGGNSITLTDPANIMGNLAVTGGTVSITENASITQGSGMSNAWTTGTTTLDVSASAGSGIVLTNPANVLGAIAIEGTPNAISITENAAITQASAWVQPTTPVTLNSGFFDTVLSQAGNQLGALTITARDATVVEDAPIMQGGAWTVSGNTVLNAGTANPIELNNAASAFGTVSIVSASNADIEAEGPVIFGTSTIAAGGQLTISASGAITQSGAITAPSLLLIGTGNATLTNEGNDVGTLAAGFTGGDLNFTNGGLFAVGVLGGTTGVTIGDANVTLTSVNGTVTGLSNVNAGSASLTISTGAALSLPQLSIAGPQTYTAGGAGITLTTNLTSTAPGAITFNSPVTLGSDLTVQTTNSAINFNGTLAGANSQSGVNTGFQLDVNAGSGLVVFEGAVTGLGRANSTSPALTLNSGGAVFDTTLSTNNALAVSGPVTFEDTVTLGDGGVASVFSGLVTLDKVGGMNLSGNGMSFNDGVLLQDGPATIDSNNSPLTFQTAGTVSGPFGLTLNSGTAALTGLNFIGTNLTSLTVTASSPTIPSTGISIAGPQTYTATDNNPITLQGNVTSTAAGAITFSSPVSVGSNVTVASTNSPVVFASTVSASSNLTVNAGTGTTTFTGAVGGVTPLGNGTGAAIVLQGSGATTFDGTVKADSGITAAGAVTFDGNVMLTDGNTGSTFNGLVTTGGSAGNTISGFDGIAFNGGLTVTGGPVSVLSNGSTISFGGAVSGAENLTLDALAGGAGTVTGLNEIGANSNLTSLNITGQTLGLPSTGLAVAGPMTFTAPGGITVNGNVGSTTNPATGAITFMSPVTLAAGPITVSDANAAVTFNGTVDGAEPLTVNAGTGAVAFNAAVGSTTRLTSVAIAGSGTTTLDAASIATGGAQTYDGPVVLAQNSTLTGGDVQFSGTVDGAHALTVDGSGTTTFEGVIGGNTPLASLTVTATGGIDLNASAVTTSGAQTYNSAVTLGTDAAVSGIGITFGSTVDGAHALNANSGGGTLQFEGAVGGATPLTSVTASGNAISAATVTTGGTQSYTANGVTLSGNLGGVGITFNAPVNVVPASGNSITLNSGTGTLTFADAAQFNANNMTLTGDSIAFGGPVTGSGNLTIQPSTGSLDVAVGGTPIAGLNLSTAQLAELPIGTLASLTIGSATGTGTLNVAGALNVGGTPLTLNGGGGITQSGGSITSGPLTLFAADNAITLANGSNAFGAVAINGSPSSVSLTNTLDIDQLGSAGWALGDSPVTLNAGTNNITLENAGNTFGTLVLNGNNVQVAEAASADIGASNITGNLAVTAAGGINFSGALDATGNVSLSSGAEVTQSAPLAIGGNLSVTTTADAGDVTLDNSGATIMGNTQVGGNYTLTSTGSVSQAAGTSYQVAGTLAVTGTNIVLGSAGNIAGATSLSGSTSSANVIDQSGVITLPSMDVTGNLTVVSESATRSISSSPATGDAIVLTNASNAIAGSISVSASPPTVTTSGTELQTGINQAANTSLSVSGVASFTAQASSVAGSGNINLTNVGNSLSTLELNGSTVNVTNAAAGVTTLNSALATNSLTLTTAGGVAQTGAISTPALSITAAGGVTLNNVANGVGTLAVASNGNPISFVNAGDLSIAGINAGNSTVALTAGGSGSLSQTAPLLNVSTLNADAGGSIVLTNTGNSIATLGTSTAGTGLQLFNSTGLGVSGIVGTTTGDLTVRTMGDLTLQTGGQLEALAGNLVASTEGDGNLINDSSSAGMALLVGSGDRWLVYSDNPDLVADPTVKGGLTSSFRGYGETFSTDAPSDVTQSGNGFIYSHAPGTLSITATIDGTPTQVYGSLPTATVTDTVTGFLDSEDNVGNTITGGTATFNTALSNSLNAGTYNILYTGGLTSANYSLAAGTTPAVYTVTPAVLTYNATPASRTYGAANSAFGGTISGFVLNQTASEVLTGSATFTTAATPSSGVGQYAIDGSGLSSNGNYTFVQAGGNATALTINKADLVVTANNDTVTYNGSNFSGGDGVAFSGFVNNDSSSVLGGTVTFGGTSQGARNAGTYVITPAGLAAANYTITYDNGSLAIDPAALDVTTSNVSRTYNGTLAAAGTPIVTGGTQLFGGDTLSGGAFAFTNANAGTDKTVTVSGVSVNDGNDGGNYAVTYVSNTASTITPATLQVAGVVALNTVYNGTTTANLNTQGAVLTGVIGSDSVSVGSITGSYLTPTVGTNKPITTSGFVLTGADAMDYTLEQPTGLAASITPLLLTVTATGVNKVYNGSTAATVVLSDNAIPGDSLTVTSTNSFQNASVGNGKYISVSDITVSGADAVDYTLVDSSTSAYANITSATPTPPPPTPPAPTQAVAPTGVTGNAIDDGSLPPVVPSPPVNISVPTPPPSAMDLTLPAHFVLFAGPTGTAGASATTNAGNGLVSSDSAAITATAANSSPVANRSPAVGGNSAAEGADASDSIEVSMVQSAQRSAPGAVSVSIPQAVIDSGNGFSFALPPALRDAVATGTVRITFQGKGLPSWLRYSKATRTITATNGMPPGALPMQLLVRIGDRSWTMSIGTR